MLILESIPERPEAPGIPSKEIDTAAVILGSTFYHEDTVLASITVEPFL